MDEEEVVKVIIKEENDIKGCCNFSTTLIRIKASINAKQGKLSMLL